MLIKLYSDSIFAIKIFTASFNDFQREKEQFVYVSAVAKEKSSQELAILFKKYKFKPILSNILPIEAIWITFRLTNLKVQFENWRVLAEIWTMFRGQFCFQLRCCFMPFS